MSNRWWSTYKFLGLLLITQISYATGFDCESKKVCYQSKFQDRSGYTEGITYQRPPPEAKELLLAVLHTLGFEVLDQKEQWIKAVKKSSFLKTESFFYFSIENKIIHLKAHADSPNLDWGDTQSLIEKIKFRFYQNNM